MGSKKQEKSKALIPRWLHCFHALLHLQPEPYIVLARTRSCAITPQGWVLGCLHLARGRPQRLTDPDHGFQGEAVASLEVMQGAGTLSLLASPAHPPRILSTGWRHHFSLERVAEETASSLAE